MKGTADIYVSGSHDKSCPNLKEGCVRVSFLISFSIECPETSFLLHIFPWPQDVFFPEIREIFWGREIECYIFEYSTAALGYCSNCGLLFFTVDWLMPQRWSTQFAVPNSIMTNPSHPQVSIKFLILLYCLLCPHCFVKHCPCSSLSNHLCSNSKSVFRQWRRLHTLNPPWTEHRLFVSPNEKWEQYLRFTWPT